MGRLNVAIDETREEGHSRARKEMGKSMGYRIAAFASFYFLGATQVDAHSSLIPHSHSFGSTSTESMGFVILAAVLFYSWLRVHERIHES